MSIRRRVARAQAKDGILLVPGATNAHVVSVLRAMLTSGTEYGQAALNAFDALVELVKPTVNTPAFVERVKLALVELVKPAVDTPAFNEVEFLSAVRPFDEACIDFATRFAEGSKPLAELVSTFAMVDASGIDVLSLDSDRKAHSESWGTMSGPSSPARPEIRKQVKAKGWVHVPRSLERDAADFVAAYFESKTVLAWIEATVPEDELKHYGVANIYNAFTPFRKALELHDRPQFIAKNL
jgi:hypothetical protein